MTMQSQMETESKKGLLQYFWGMAFFLIVRDWLIDWWQTAQSALPVINFLVMAHQTWWILSVWNLEALDAASVLRGGKWKRRRNFPTHKKGNDEALFFRWQIYSKWSRHFILWWNIFILAFILTPRCCWAQNTHSWEDIVSSHSDHFC